MQKIVKSMCPYNPNYLSALIRRTFKLNLMLFEQAPNIRKKNYPIIEMKPDTNPISTYRYLIIFLGFNLIHFKDK
jgi:hypothetical protein